MYNVIDSYLSSLSERYGIDNFTLRFAICLLGSYPLNAILKRLPDSNIKLKCYYIIAMSSLYIFGILNLTTGFRTLFIDTTFTYLLTKFYYSKFMPFVNFAFLMGHLGCNHIVAQWLSYDGTVPLNNQIDITSSQMVLVMKLTSFAWSYYDGTQTSKEDFETYLTRDQQSRAVREHPSLLRFYAYAFFYPTLLTGPSFDFVDFNAWLTGDLFADVPEELRPVSRFSKIQLEDKKERISRRRLIPRNGRLGLWKIVQGLTWMALFVYLPKYISIDFVLDTPNFMKHSFLYRIHYLYLVGMAFRFKYYAAWTISEGACILCGLGYNGYDQRTKTLKWDRVKNIDIKRVEMAQSTKECLEAWNMNTNKWLKNFVYLRVARRGSKPGFRSTLFTFSTSAFWHGVKPGYYMTFVSGALYQTCGKLYRRNFRPIFLEKDGKTPTKYKWIYDVVCDYVIKLSFGYLVQPFIALNIRDSWTAWKSVYFYCHIIVAISLFAFKGPFSKQLVEFLRSLQRKESDSLKQKKLEADIMKRGGSLAGIIQDKIAYENQEQKIGTTDSEIERAAASFDMNLGIPDLDPPVDWKDAKEEWNMFVRDYKEWTEKKNMELERDNLVRAFQKFREEVSNVTSVESGRRRFSFSFFLPGATEKEQKND